MAIYVMTEEPSDLVRRIREGINNHNIETWLCDEEGDFTHDTDQWRYHAWMTPIIEQERVVFGVICRKDRNLSITDYAIYHGRFVEMLLRHFDKVCKDIKVSPLATKYDIVDKAK
jgi:hypothetical protein